MPSSTSNVPAGSGQTVATGARGGPYQYYPCVNANSPGHAVSYTWRLRPGELCENCRVSGLKLRQLVVCTDLCYSSQAVNQWTTNGLEYAAREYGSVDIRFRRLTPIVQNVQCSI
ncbi:uncharacterized protein EI97DRAFT_299959 [Westerdykella ornata]|uniref:Uncharacterized protein n=1 Tax=Westerdykella ornata TaxID=318751 RepID=A0A6A6JP06_WESOR|nr:uncharacterized protein EI97DRAFT_299959 [Westerdykella ornata]KAF2277638.1 hypothetical protein EI97DRAFT_299959 [Westerdykella ornata]